MLLYECLTGRTPFAGQDFAAQCHAHIERLVEGEDLRSRLRDRGPLTLDETTAILEQVAEALDAAHAARVTHRDVKPSNILLAPRPRGGSFVYLVDFGIARSGTGTTLTAPIQAVETAEYMAPERSLGGGRG